MRFVRTMLAVMSVLAVVSSVALADATAAKRDITKQYAAMDKAIATKDVKGLLAHLTDDFTMMTRGGKKMTRQQAEQMLTMTSQQLPPGSLVKTTVTKVTVSGKKAVVENKGLMSASVPMNGATHKIVAKSSSRDTWVEGKGGWKMKASVELGQTMTMDGKAFNPMGGPPMPHKKR